MGDIIKFPEVQENLVEVELTSYDSGQIKEVLQILRSTISGLNGQENVPGVKEVVALLKKTYKDLL